MAALIGSHPVPVGVRLSTVQMTNGHRVLTAEGRVSPGFHWVDPSDARDVRDVLRDEGVHFDAGGAADQSQRLDAAQLAALVGLDVEGLVDVTVGRPEATEGQRRFLEQTGELQGPQIVGAVQRLADAWVAIGGSLAFGAADETSCFFLWNGKIRCPWPFTLYPSGSVEVVFQHLRHRPPFDDASLRDEFRTRLNGARDIDIAPTKIDLRPSFPMHVLMDEDAYQHVHDALTWFTKQLRAASIPNGLS